MAIKSLPVRSCLIDGEAIVRDENGLAVFDLIRRHGALATAVLCAFDLLELDGQDLRREPIEERKRLLSKLLKGQQASIVLNEHYEEDGAIVFREACKLGCKGIVSKRLGSAYRSRRSPHWVKVKNPNAPAVKREAEEDWGVLKANSVITITDDRFMFCQKGMAGEREEWCDGTVCCVSSSGYCFRDWHGDHGANSSFVRQHPR
jgi:ATP dependent DNA ligase domain